MKKIFDNKISWKQLIMFSSLIGIYTGIVMCIPFLKNTSFQDIGITYEWWVLFAIMIVCNCKKWHEAALKCFVFFLISQPLVYIIEIIFNKISLSMGIYYYLHIWLPITFLTLPGGLISYFAKKQNIIGSIILGIGNTILITMGYYYLLNTLNNFPHHLLTVIYCFIAIIILTINIQKGKINRIISFSIPIILLILIIYLSKLIGLTIY